MSQEPPVDQNASEPPNPSGGDGSAGSRNFWRWFLQGLKPGDLLTGASVLVAALGLYIAFSSLQGALDAATQQSKEAALQNAQVTRENLNNAPLLIAATPPAERGTLQTVNLNFGQVTKRADRLYIAAASRTTARARIVIPLQNGGNGLAVIYGRPTIVGSCDREPGELPKKLASGPAVYVVRSGEADQFGFFQPDRYGTYADGHTTAGPYTFNYERYGEIRYATARGKRSARSPSEGNRRQRLRGRGAYEPPAAFINVLVWYSDGARSALRWLCVQYETAGVFRGGTQWAVYNQTSGVEVP